MKDKTRKLITGILDFLILFFIYINLGGLVVYLKFVFNTITPEISDVIIFSFVIVLILFLIIILFLIKKRHVK